MNPLNLQSLQSTALSLFETSRTIYWASLPAAFLLAIVMMYLTGDISGGSFERLFKRLIFSMLLLASFPLISDTLVNLETGLVSAFGGDESLKTIFSRIANHAEQIKDASSSNWLKFGQWGLTIISTLSFLILSVVEHFLDVLHLTIWNLLHILGPLALLGCLFPSFVQVPKGIFLSLFELSLWRPVWVILGRILISIGFGDAPPDPSMWFDTAVMNFAVAGLMVSTPMLVHGFLSGALASSGAGALQTMVGGAGAALGGMPVSALRSTSQRLSSAGWRATGGKMAESKASQFLASKMPKYWFPERKSNPKYKKD